MSLRRKDTPSVAAAKASFSTATGYRIESDPRPPSQKRPPRASRRRDPLDGIFEKEVVPLLVECPGGHGGRGDEGDLAGRPTLQHNDSNE